ncbi:Vi polysaccharide biosynthesis UDP-N-acetylglucosamine C-6 dehydrogenase TviB [Prolixibacter denitrificans]|uniref:UDP-N-acetyl-D-galactosamine dehydrogenase n=1 Tax=Prolixibacter denitrificans TaxID=1541063 RepID=A0A2P8CDU9_9BACT|nr:Vi polysaccharide biosynthesis UDP-N-acetylglucosamine C-6 dehydrogenase TviB [Prolixibacter denitrificans]PSK83126.1 UDP-N-acetyl-D-galactosamine dehydrogenase [Prolixibacter denitrificans]GET21991.1 UDP-glucose/GDP-mannose dehydrogenase [Prolixibacter denitrificans]
MTDIRIAVIGLGYVGLPLAVEFGKKLHTVGFDINSARIEELKKGHDQTLEITDSELKTVLGSPDKVGRLQFTDEKKEISDCNFFIITVPTPVDKNNRPNLTPLCRASQTVAFALKKGDIVIYESTVYPGVTEEECVPVLERFSGLKFNEDFFVGYSPERINPGDKKHTVTRIKKVTSGSTPETAEKVDQLYKTIITAGTHKAPSIKVAEAAKVIENSQRDINIAFVNELAKIFNRLNIDTQAVLEAAGTKWNFLPFRPGLVGGHCIGVDPYYLAQKAQEVGYHPEIILAGRRMNDGMGHYVAAEVVKLMIQHGISIKQSKVLIMGITFKENCPDIRNTKVINMIDELCEFGCKIDVYDPWAHPDEVEKVYHIPLVPTYQIPDYDAVVLAVAHHQFENFDFNLCNSHTVVYDVKGFWPSDKVDGRL